MTKKEKEQLAGLKSKIRMLRKQSREDKAYWQERCGRVRDESNIYQKQAHCIYSKEHKDVFDRISVEDTRVVIYYKCPFCGFVTHRLVSELCQAQRAVLTELGIVPKGGE